MAIIRQAAVAGTFYPAAPHKLESMIRNFLVNAKENLPAPKAIIAPHAGYVYSGSIAANAYACLANVCHKIKRVVLVGASHHVYFKAIAASRADYFSTPLGQVKVDQDAISKISAFTDIKILDEAHFAEHSLEVQLPFLQILLKNFSIIPLLAGVIAPQQIAKSIEALWGGLETLVIISSDLSHYFDYKTAQNLDQKTAQAIIDLNPQNIQDEQACGLLPIKGLLEVAIKKHLQAKVIDLRNSGDTSGLKDKVVGYGAFHFFERQKE